MKQADLKQRIEARVNQGLLGQWYVIAKSAEVGARPLKVTALGRELVLWRGADGQVRCIENRCPHRGARLSQGVVVDNNIACRYHGVTLDGAGVIVDVPAMHDCPLQGRKALDGFPVAESNDGVLAYFPSHEHPKPRELQLPKELAGEGYTSFLCSAPWACNYRYVLDNLVDLMHAIYLHSDTFTLSDGKTQDEVRLEESAQGFVVTRVGQQGINFDWGEAIVEASLPYARVLIPYPKAGGPGGP